MNRQAVIGELPVNDNSDVVLKARRLTMPCKKHSKVSTHLKIADENDGSTIRIPISRKIKPVLKEKKPEEWTTILTPVRFCRELSIDVQAHHPSDAKKKKLVRLENKSWIYVFVNGFLWRELQIKKGTTSATYYHDVDLLKYEGRIQQDDRLATGQRLNRVILPIKIENKQVTVEVAYSDIQWSWARIESMGGVAPKGKKRKDWFPDEYSLNSKGKKLREVRMQKLPLYNGYQNAFSKSIEAVRTIKDCNLHEFKIDDGKKFPFIALKSHLSDAKDLAFTYQQSWRNLESHINEISNPENKKNHEFSPWFQSAMLANQYFFVEQPNIESAGVGKNIGKPSDKTKKWRKAKEQRSKWQSQLSLADIQKALGTEKRKELRKELLKAKKELVKYLSKNSSHIKYLVSEFDDYCTLSSKKDEKCKTHCGLRYKLSDELLARIGDHELTIDYHLETKPPTQKKFYNQRCNDKGYVLLGELASGSHPLSDRLFIAKLGDKASVSTQNLNDDDPVITLDKMARIGRRSTTFIANFAQHFASVAVDKKFSTAQEAIANLFSNSGLGTSNIKKISISGEEYLTGVLRGDNAKKYGILRIEVIDVDTKLKGRVSKIKASETGINTEKLTTELDVYDPNGGLVGSTSLDAFNNGKAFSRKWIRKKGKKTQWNKYTVSVWVFEKPTGAALFSKKIVDSPMWSKSILPMVAFFEAVNLQTYFNNWKSAKGNSDKESIELAGAIVDLTAVIASINEARLANSHHQNQKISNIQLQKSTAYLKAIRSARVLGAGASAFSAYLSIESMLQNVYEGDDSAIAHGIMALGFTLALASEVIAGLAAFKVITIAQGSAIAFAAGPLGWIALGIILVGAALLIWIFTEDTKLEKWLANSPFSIKPAKEYPYRNHTGYSNYDNQYGSTYQAYNSNFVTDTSGNLVIVTKLMGSKVISDSKGNYYVKEHGAKRKIAELRKPLNTDLIADRSQRFAGVKEEDKITDKYGLWRIHPEACYDALVDSIYQPTVSLDVHDHGKAYKPDYELDLMIHIPNYIDNKTIVRIVLYERKNLFKSFERNIMTGRIITPNGSGARTIHVKHRFKKYVSMVGAKVWLDLYGNDTVTLPMGEQSWTDAQEKQRQKILTNQRIKRVGTVNTGKEKKEEEKIPAYVRPKQKPIFVKASVPLPRRGMFNMS